MHELRTLVSQLAASPANSALWAEALRSWQADPFTPTDSYWDLLRLIITVADEGAIPCDNMLMTVTAVELSRWEALSGSLALPADLAAEYESSLHTLMLHAHLLIADQDRPAIRGALALLLVSRGLHIYATAVLEYSEQELSEFLTPKQFS